ncbi:MAG: EAL domain-containing protein [Lachnospiraceae bacterium]|nr:EAL domain-containing protein [Lachnospiraceae bacterium]
MTATYLSTVLLIVLIMAGVLRRDGGMNPKRRRALITWLALWLIAAAVQFMNNRLLVVGFARALGVMVLFFELENPESNIDRTTGFFNANAFWEFMRQNYMSNANNCGMLVSLEDSASKDVRGDRLDAAVIEIADFFRRVPETKIFRMDEYEFALLFANQENLDRARHILAKRFSEPWLEYNEKYAPINIKPYYLIVPAGNVAGSVNEVIGMMKYFRAHYMNNLESRVLVLNEDVICRKKAREDMLHTITEALENDRVEVFFQPIYSTQLKKFVSAEALVRIRKEDGGIIPPGMFIPIAEETGMISWIGKRVFEKTCEFIKQTDIGRYGIEYIEVNLSVGQCEDEALADLYIDVMERYKISPSLINLEITESASIIMRKTLLNNMRKLIDYGVSFSLDDFGNGESNLNYIVDMPVHIVKFDKDMTQAYFVSEKAKYVLQAATDMIQGLHLQVVSEGVETAEQLRAMERLGIDYIQGYYFSRPLEASQFIEFLKVANG